MALWNQAAAAQSSFRGDQRPEVRRLGLSRVGENTLLTLVLDRNADAKISTRMVSGKPQLVVDLPQARAGRLPSRLEGDEILVDQVLTENVPPGGGVRIVLDLYPDQPYVYWRQTRPGADHPHGGVETRPAAPQGGPDALSREPRPP
jgi:hypothetical protein